MKKRRGKGEGAIYQRDSDGLFVASLDRGIDGQGRRKRKNVYGKTRQEVRQKLLKLQMEAMDGTLQDVGPLTVGTYLAQWLDREVRVNVRYGTYVDYAAVVRNHITPRIGRIQLGKLTPLQVQGLYSELERDGITPRVRQKVHVVLHRALHQALRWGMVTRNVCSAVNRPRVAKKQIQALTPEESKRLLEAARTDRLYALYVLAVTGGLRQGELLGLQWADLDLRNGRLSVVRTLLEHSGKHSVGEPKSAKGRRAIPLPKIAIDALREHRKRMLAEGHAALWVFCDTAGGALRKSNLTRRSFIPLLAKAGLPRIRFHDLRHTAATLLLTQGVHAKVVQERLGHSQISLTLDTYSHVLPSLQEEAATKLDSLFREQTG